MRAVTGRSFPGARREGLKMQGRVQTGTNREPERWSGRGSSGNAREVCVAGRDLQRMLTWRGPRAARIGSISDITSLLGRSPPWGAPSPHLYSLRLRGRVAGDGRAQGPGLARPTSQGLTGVADYGFSEDGTFVQLYAEDAGAGADGDGGAHGSRRRVPSRPQLVRGTTASRHGDRLTVTGINPNYESRLTISVRQLPHGGLPPGEPASRNHAISSSV